MDEDKTFPVLNLPPVRFIGGPSKQARTGNIQVAWYPDILVSVATDIGVPVEEELSEIGMNVSREVINLECDCEEDRLKPL